MEMMFLSSASAWARQGIECDILSMAASLGSMAPRLKAVGYGIFHIPFRSKYRFLPNIGFLLHFYRLCRDRTMQYTFTQRRRHLFMPSLQKLPAYPRWH
jgi:hypothetical protein